MKRPTLSGKKPQPPSTPGTASLDLNQSRLLSDADGAPCLDTVELNRLEQSFRAWADAAKSPGLRHSRRRILLIFLIIRYTGAKLNEVLALKPAEDMDNEALAIRFKNSDPEEKHHDEETRLVYIPELLATDIINLTEETKALDKSLDVDPGFVRRKFYERAEACGFAKNMGGPEMIRRARAVELMKNSLPIPAVQMMLGHATPNLTSSYVSFSKEEIQKMTRLYMARESSRKTSARNSFFGKVSEIRQGDIQSQVTLTTLGGDSISTVITNDSMDRLGIRPGSLLSAEIKAPWVVLQKNIKKPRCSADNILKGVITRINEGTINVEYAARIEDGTEMCSIVATQGAKNLDIQIGDPVWILFTCFAVVLHVD